MIPANFKRPKKSKETFVSGGVNIEDVHITHPKPTIEKEASVRMQVYLTQSHREWSSRGRELPPPPLTEPYVKLSLHTALMIQPKV